MEHAETLAASRAPSRWTERRLQALLVRAVVYLAPIGGSVLFVHFASKVVRPPSSSFLLYAAWWLGISLSATAVLVAVDRVTRRLLPLAALLKLSLVFPDEAPSRFKVAFRSGSVEHLRERITDAAAAAQTATPSEAAAQLLELVALLNIHDKLTRGHCDRVRAYAVLIGKELGLSEHELDLLNWAALLHDVGKLEVPEAILQKPGKPTPEEWQVLREHPLFGETLVEPMQDWLGHWTQAVGYHHERWDGKGYPRGLAGEDIPLPGRIVAVADVFDVITSVRSYKKAAAVAEARSEIARCAGSQFDPHVVRAFLNVSLGRMRFVMGPLSMLAHAPLLGRLPFTPAMGTFTGALSVAATSAAGGVVAPPHAAEAAATPPPPPPAHVRHAVPAPPAPPHRALIVPAPLARDDHATLYEGETAQIPVLRNDGGTGLQLQSVGRPAHGDATALGTAILYHAALGFRGSVRIRYVVTDAAGRTSAATATVETLGVNHAPAFLAGGDVTLLENQSPQSRPWATAIDAGAGDTGQHVRFAITDDNPALFSEVPVLAPDGTLTVAPAHDVFGTATVDVVALDDGGTAHGGRNASAPHTFSVRVLPVNQPPVFAAGGDVRAHEGSGPQSLAWASQIAPGPANEAGQQVAFTTSATHPELFAVGGEPAVDKHGVLTFTPAAFAGGTSMVTVTARDDGGTANGGRDATTATFTLTVMPVNRPPIVHGIGDLTVAENAGPQSVQWTTSIDAGAPNETWQAVTLTASDDRPALFSARPRLSPRGVLTYTPAPGASGTATITVTAHDDGGTSGGGADTSTTRFRITVEHVNEPPSFTAGGDRTVLEDAGRQAGTWATDISPGRNESNQTVTFTTTNDRPSLFSVPPAIDRDGVLTYTPAPNANGTATVIVTARDDGGTANGGRDATSATFTITILPVNDPPTFTAAGNQVVLEDAGPQSTQWATAISPGPGETGQTVTFTTGNDDASLFSVQPAIGSTGVLTYTPAANANGTATVTVTARDDGGTSGGGRDATTVTFTITVNPVNDPPTFSPTPADQSATEGDGPQTVALTTMSAGPANEPQTLTVSTSVDHPEYFDPAGQPSVAADGTLTYTPASSDYGTAHVTVTATDSGGASTSATFAIVIAPLPPVAGDDAYSTTLGTALTIAAPGVLANDADVNSATLTVTAETGLATAKGGTLDLSSDGSFTYTPPALYTGQDSFTYTITDSTGQTATATVTIDVTALAPSTTTWYLDTTGPSSDVWNLSSSAPAAVSPIPDLDGDGSPGLTIDGGDGKQTINDAHKQHAWALETGLVSLPLQGSLTLHLTAASANYALNKSERIWVYVYDCPGGSSTLSISSCTLIGSNDVLVPDWNTTASWATHDIVVPLSSTLGIDRQLRVRVLVSGVALWIPLVSPDASSVDFTG